MKHLIATLFLFMTTASSTAQDLQVAGFENNFGGWTVITNSNQHCGDREMHNG